MVSAERTGLALASNFGMKKAVIVALLLTAVACMKKDANGTYRIENPMATKKSNEKARQNAAKSNDAVKKIESGSREVAEGVKEGATAIAAKVKASAKKVKQEVKTDTRH